MRAESRFGTSRAAPRGKPSVDKSVEIFLFSARDLYPCTRIQYERTRVCSGEITSYVTPRQRIFRVINEVKKFAT